MDKDTLVKNHFWILAAVACLLALAGWVLVILTGPSSAAGKGVEDAKKKWKGAKSYTDFKHRQWIDDKTVEANLLKEKGSKIHSDLFTEQTSATDLMKWPDGMKQRGYDIESGKFAFEIDVHPPKTSSKTMPADREAMMSGTLVKSSEDWFEIDNPKEKTVKFLRPIVVKITDKQDPGKKLESNFGPLGIYEGRLVTVKYLTGKHFGSELTEAEKGMYRETYHEQIPKALAALKPLNEMGRPQVMLRYIRDIKLGPIDLKKEKFEVYNDTWLYQPKTLPPPDNRFLPYVKRWIDKLKDITSEEIWAAQETLWIHREMFKQLSIANDALAHFEPAGKNAKPNTFRNFYWEIELNLSDDGVAATLKNLRPHPQTIDGLHFTLRFKGQDGKPGPAVLFPPQDKPFKDNPVGPTGGGKDIFVTKKPYAVNDGGATEIAAVDQVLTVETAAVKRVDVIMVGAAINGDVAVTQKAALKMKDGASPLLSLDKAKKGGQFIPPDLDLNDPNFITPPPPELTFKVSRHHIILERYVEAPSSESRKLPVNLVMVVGPEHLSLVEAALVSSPLRFFPTQVLWQRTQLPLPGLDLTKPGNDIQDNIELSFYGTVTIYQRPGWAIVR